MTPPPKKTFQSRHGHSSGEKDLKLSGFVYYQAGLLLVAQLSQVTSILFAARRVPGRVPAASRTLANGGARFLYLDFLGFFFISVTQGQVNSTTSPLKVNGEKLKYFERFLHSTLNIFFINCSTDINPTSYLGLNMGPSSFTLKKKLAPLKFLIF